MTRPPMAHRLLRIAAAALASFMASCAAASAGDPRSGASFAKRNCASCHAIGGAGASPNPKSPPFRIIARKYKLEDLEESFAEGMVTGHNAMPEFTLSPRQIDDLLAHMRRLRRR